MGKIALTMKPLLHRGFGFEDTNAGNLAELLVEAEQQAVRALSGYVCDRRVRETQHGTLLACEYLDHLEKQIRAGYKLQFFGVQ